MIIFLSSLLQSKFVDLYIGGEREKGFSMYDVQFDIDLSQRSVIVPNNHLICNIQMDCSFDKHNYYNDSLQGSTYYFYNGSTNINFEKRRMKDNMWFRYVIKSERNILYPILGLNRHSEFLEKYLADKNRQSNAFKLKYTSNNRIKFKEGEDVYNYIDNPKFDVYNFGDNESYFYIRSKFITKEVSGDKVIFERFYNLCLIADPYYDYTGYLMGEEKMIQELLFFLKRKVDPRTTKTILKSIDGKFTFDMNKLFSMKKIVDIFTIRNEYNGLCDLYINPVFMSFFNMELIFLYKESQREWELYYKQQNNDYHMNGTSAVIIIVLLIAIVLLCTTSNAPSAKGRASAEPSMISTPKSARPVAALRGLSSMPTASTPGRCRAIRSSAIELRVQ